MYLEVRGRISRRRRRCCYCRSYVCVENEEQHWDGGLSSAKRKDNSSSTLNQSAPQLAASDPRVHACARARSSPNRNVGRPPPAHCKQEARSAAARMRSHPMRINRAAPTPPFFSRPPTSGARSQSIDRIRWTRPAPNRPRTTRSLQLESPSPQSARSLTRPPCCCVTTRQLDRSRGAAKQRSRAPASNRPEAQWTDGVTSSRPGSPLALAASEPGMPRAPFLFGFCSCPPPSAAAVGAGL